MATLGVAKKQTARARQVFERSANQGGFFATGRDRLVLPAFRDTPSATPSADSSRAKNGGSGGSGSGHGSELHPLILGLIERLPPADSVWPPQEREKWLRLAESIFSMMYSDEGPSSGGSDSE